MRERVVAIITTRQGSKRLPDKANADIGGVSMTRRIVDELRLSSLIDDVWIATDTTSMLKGDVNCTVYHGEDYDVLARLCEAAKWAEADIIVRLWGDSPLIDHRLIDHGIKKFIEIDVDYAFTEDYPAGMRFTIIRRKALENVVSQMSVKDRAIWNKVDENLIWFVLEKLVGKIESHTNFSHVKLDVDTEEDLELVRSIFAGEGDV